MKVGNYFTAGEDPPLLGRLLASVDDDALFPPDMADIAESPPEFITGPDGKIVQKSAGVIRKASAEEVRAFRDGCKEAMRDIYRFALFCWAQDIDQKFVELARSVEVGTALIDKHEPFLNFHYASFSDAIVTIARQPDLQEDDAVPFLYFMQGVFLASREECYWQRQKVPGGPEKPWQHM